MKTLLLRPSEGRVLCFILRMKVMRHIVGNPQYRQQLGRKG
jgi:hypothetical protein